MIAASGENPTPEMPAPAPYISFGVPGSKRVLVSDTTATATRNILWDVVQCRSTDSARKGTPFRYKIPKR